MNIEELKREALTIIQSMFPAFIVRIEDAEDDRFSIGVGIFKVPYTMGAGVREKVYEVDELLLRGTGYSLIAIIRDEETTSKYYEELLRPIAVVDIALTNDMLKDVDVDMDYQQDSLNSTNAGISFLAANHELALAA